MASFNRTFSASPVLVMPSQSAHQSPFAVPISTHQRLSYGNVPLFGFNPSIAHSYVSPSTSERRGRKRSRDEASVNLDERAPVMNNEPEKLKRDWVYGSENGVDASGQQAEVAQNFRHHSTVLPVKQPEQQPFLRSSKSQRLDSSSLAASSKSQLPSPSGDTTAPPAIDNFTITFGIGWRLVSAQSNISAAVRGWARYIENHYPITNVKIQAESKSLQSYLVEADEGWFLFDENLRQGRLVSTSNTRCIENLKASPPVFEGSETMSASHIPSALSVSPQTDVDMN